VAEWWTYRPSDFLMFSPRIYWRLFESINLFAWPLQPLLIAAGLGWLRLQSRGPAGTAWSRRTTLVLALVLALVLSRCWLFVAWAFLWQRFAPIQWVATGYATAFALQGAGWLVLAWQDGLRASTEVARRRIGTGLGLWALLAHPLLALADGRPWQQAEVFGLAPDPTAIGTLAVLLLVRAEAARTRAWLRLLWLVPLGWCAVSAATLATMGSWQAAVPLAAAALAAATARWGR